MLNSTAGNMPKIILESNQNNIYKYYSPLPLPSWVFSQAPAGSQTFASSVSSPAVDDHLSSKDAKDVNKLFLTSPSSVIFPRNVTKLKFLSWSQAPDFHVLRESFIISQ